MLWALGTLYLGGDLGKLTDDYAQHRYDFVKDTWSWPPFQWSEAFWRPVHLMIVETLQTVLWKHDRVNHVISALAHGLAAWLVWRVLLAAGRSRRVAAAGGLLFLVYPVGWEVIFWPAALSTGLATSLLLVMMLIYCRWARGGPRWERAWWVAAVLPALAFLMCCLNEQPAAGVAALPLLYLAVAPREPWRRRLVRAVVPAGLAAAACGVYLLLYFRTAGPGMRGTSETLIQWDALPHRLAWFAGSVRARMIMHDFRGGAFRFGWRQMAEHWPTMLAWAAAVVLGAGAWVRWWMTVDEREPGARHRLPLPEGGGWGKGLPGLSPVAAGERRRPDREEDKTDAERRSTQMQREESPSPGLLPLGGGVFGVGLLVAAWLPFIPFAVYGADSRAAYAPFVGVVFVIAALMDAGAALARRGGPLLRPVRLATAAALACVLLGQAVMLVGVQEVMRGRHRLDMDEMRQLKELLPAPPDGTVFMPMRVRSLAAHTGDGAFDDAPPPALRTPWFAPPIVRWTYRKWRLFSGHAGPAKNWLIAGGDAQNLILTERLGFASKPRPDGMFDLPWGKVFPFEVDGRGRVLVISRVVFKRGGEFVAEARPRMAAALAEAGRVPERTFEVEVGKK